MKIFNPKKADYVKICPRCKSIQIKMELISGWFIGLPPSFKCQDCGFRSKFFPEIEVEKNNKDGKK